MTKATAALLLFFTPFFAISQIESVSTKQLIKACSADERLCNVIVTGIAVGFNVGVGMGALGGARTKGLTGDDITEDAKNTLNLVIGANKGTDCGVSFTKTELRKAIFYFLSENPDYIEADLHLVVMLAVRHYTKKQCKIVTA